MEHLLKSTPWFQVHVLLRHHDLLARCEVDDENNEQYDDKDGYDDAKSVLADLEIIKLLGETVDLLVTHLGNTRLYFLRRETEIQKPLFDELHLEDCLYLLDIGGPFTGREGNRLGGHKCRLNARCDTNDEHNCDKIINRDSPGHDFTSFHIYSISPYIEKYISNINRFVNIFRPLCESPVSAVLRCP